MRTKTGIWLVAGAWALFACGTAQGAWVQLGTSLNITPNQNGQLPKIAISNNRPYVIWSENNPTYSRIHVYVKQWNGSGWVLVGNALNIDVNQNATYPGVACSSTRQYVTWLEGTTKQAYVSGWNGTAWTIGTNISNNGSISSDRPAIAMLADTPHVAWLEGSNIYAKLFNGTSWEQLGSGAINTVTAAFYPRISLQGPLPLVAFYESPGLIVKQFTGGNWQYVHGRVNNSTTGVGMGGMTTSSTVTFVTWFENSPSQIYVKSDNGSAWAPLGGSLNVDPAYNAYNPKIALSGSIPYVAWYEASATVNQVYVKFFNGTSYTWQDVGGSLNVDPARAAGVPDIAISPLGVYVVWTESDGVADQVYVKHWAFPAAVPSATPTSIRTPTPTPTPPVVAGTLGMNSVLAYPNPASGQATFVFRADSGSGPAVARLYNTHYRLAAEARGTATDGQGSIALDVSGLAQGVYFYQVVANGKKLPMGKVVVAR